MGHYVAKGMVARPYLFVNGGKTMKLSMGKVMKTAMIAGGLAALPTVAHLSLIHI